MFWFFDPHVSHFISKYYTHGCPSTLFYFSQGLFPGDIQKVRAVPRKNFAPFIFLDEVLVFSAKGDRPLGDMLGGGDLDGDEYVVVYEPQIVDVVITTKAHNYNTQNFSAPKMRKLEKST